MSADEELQIAFCWYQPEEWKILKEVAADPDKLDDTYEEWRTNAASSFDELRGQGLNIKKVNIKISELEAWCHENGKQLNGEARSGFAAAKLQQRQK